jgi:prolyl oligopeptidase
MREGVRRACRTVLGISCLFLAEAQAPPGPPPTRQDNVREVIHGVEIIDPYRWLEDQESPETRAWIESQNRHSEALLRDRPSLPGLRKRLAELMGWSE